MDRSYKKYRIIPSEIIEAMQGDRNAGGVVEEIAINYGVSVATVRRHTRRNTELKPANEEAVTEEQKQKWQHDREGGLTIPEIAEEYGVSIRTVAVNTHRPRRYRVQRNGMMRERTEIKTPITKDEIAAVRASLYPGEMWELIVTYYDEEKMIQRKIKERCVIEHVSRHVVVFRKPNGRMESRTVVELCQLKRMECNGCAEREEQIGSRG